MRPSTSVFAALALLVGCPGEGDPVTDDDDSATPAEESCPDAAQPSHPCLEGCGNELGVGFPCAPGEGQCSTQPSVVARFCTSDFNDETDLSFCTGPCVVDEDCGTNALCTGDPSNPAAGRGCFPLSCWTPPPWETNQFEPAPLQ